MITKYSCKCGVETPEPRGEDEWNADARVIDVKLSNPVGAQIMNDFQRLFTLLELDFVLI